MTERQRHLAAIAVAATIVLAAAPPVHAAPAHGHALDHRHHRTRHHHYDAAAKAVSSAFAQRGKPYKYGSAGPHAFDCSGLTQFAWRQAGVVIPRTSQAQARYGTPIKAASVRPGDLVFYFANRSHVGIYMGGGLILESPHRGTVVQSAPIYSMPVSAVRRP